MFSGMGWKTNGGGNIAVDDWKYTGEAVEVVVVAAVDGRVFDGAILFDLRMFVELVPPKAEKSVDPTTPPLVVIMDGFVGSLIGLFIFVIVALFRIAELPGKEVKGVVPNVFGLIIRLLLLFII